MQASDELEMNAWIGLINYASAYRTAKIHVESSSMRAHEAGMAGRAAAASYQHDIRSIVDSTEERAGGAELQPLPLPDNSAHVRSLGVYTDTRNLGGADRADKDGGDQIGAVFGTVKARIASARDEKRRLTKPMATSSAQTARAKAFKVSHR